MSFDMQAAIEGSRDYLSGRLKVRIVHPLFGYVMKIERGKETGAKTGAEFTRDVKEAAEWTCSELRLAQDANGNGIMALLVASYGGLYFEQVKPAAAPAPYRRLKLAS